MNGKKIFMLLACIMCFATSLFAETALTVTREDGSKFYYLFSKEPEVTFEGDNVNIWASEGDVSFLLTDLVSFTFEDIPVGVLDINADGKVKLTQDMVVVTGLQDGDAVNVFDVKGIKVASAQAVNGVASVSLSNLHNGVYVVKSKNVSYKISRK